MNQPAGVPGIAGGVVTDLNTGVVAESIETCIDACVGYATWNGRCVAVTYEANITAALEPYGSTGNCIFKAQRTRDVYMSDEGMMISAYLIE